MDNWNPALTNGPSESDSGMSCETSPRPSLGTPEEEDGERPESPLDFSIKKASEGGVKRSAFAPFSSSMLPTGQASLPAVLPPFFNPMLAGLLPPLNHVTSPLLAHLNGGSLPIPTDPREAKMSRPFKAYNPTDPLSALQVNGGQVPNMDLMAHYRQCLINAQASAARAKSRSGSESGQGASNSSNTPSPNQVTSTSHPHTESVSPQQSISVPVTKSEPTPVITSACGKTKSSTRGMPEELKDQAYWERRRKNNEAAKRSRDARRIKEDEIAMRAALLEQENLRLRLEVAQLKSETEKLRQMLLNV